MPYTPPAGTAANFLTVVPGFPYPYNGLRFKLGGAYSAPTGNAVAADFPATPADYTPPLGSAANFISLGTSAWEANGAASVAFSAEGHAEYNAPTGISTGAATVPFSASANAAHGVKGGGAATVPIGGSATVGHGVAGSGAATVGVSVVGSGRVERYELTGEVRNQGILVNRTVRAYRRDTGELVGEQMTVAGRFKVHAGFAEREHYIIPIDLDNLAEDFVPPCANRVVSILAVDA